MTGVLYLAMIRQPIQYSLELEYYKEVFRMRNLKRALSLALASVMLLGMMVVGTSASYADVSSKNNLEAIEVLKAVGVMTGDDKGNFNPDANVTRNEMAVVMCNLLGLKAGGSHPFTDVPAWAQGYVAACYNNGIIAGVSADKFSGDANVTSVQAGLMVMKALGYFGFAGEFGDNWKLSTVKQANKIDLYDGINAYTDQVMTRNDVAQLVLNALQSNVVVAEEEGGLTVDGNGIIVSVKPTYTYTPARNNDGPAKDYRGGVSGDSIMQLCEKLYGNDLRKNADTTDDFGRPASEWTYHTTSIKCADEATLIYTKDVKGKKIYEDLGKPSNVLVKDSNNVTNQYDLDGQRVGVPSGFALKGTGDNVKIGAKGATTEVYYDKNTGEVNIVVTNTYLAKATDDYNKDDDELAIDVKATGTFNTTLDGDDFVLNGYKKDDYILVTATTSNGTDYTVKEIAPATVVSDVKVSAYKSTDSVTAGGTKYEYNAKALADSQALGQDYMTDTTHYTLQDTTYDLYLDGNGYVIGVEPHSDEATLTDYLFVTDAAKNGFEYQAKAQFMDGTTKTITVKKTAVNGGTMTKVNDTDTTAADGKLVKNQFCTFSVNKNDEYELTYVGNVKGSSPAVSRQQTGTAIDTDQKANVVTGGTSSSYPANAKTVFIADEKVYVGVKNAPDTTNVSPAKTVYVLLDKEGKYILAAYTEAKGTNSSSTSEYIYITSTAKTVAQDQDDNKYYMFDAVIDGKKVKGGLKVSNGNDLKVTAAGLYEITGHTDGYADLSAVITGPVTDVLTYVASASTVETKEGVLTAGGTSVVLNDKAVIYSVDATDSNAVKTVSESGVNSLKGTNFTLYLIQASKSDDTIVTAYIVRNR